METIPTTTTASRSNTRMWCVLCHALALVGHLTHFVGGHILAPLIVWLLKRHESPQIDAHGKESLNFQLSMLLYEVIAIVFCFVLIGIPFLVALWALNIIFVIVASIKASDGELWRYPLTIRFIK